MRHLLHTATEQRRATTCASEVRAGQRSSRQLAVQTSEVWDRNKPRRHYDFNYALNILLNDLPGKHAAEKEVG